MAPEQNKRPRRVPLTSEELAGLIAFKKHRERNQLIRLKRSLSYKIQNIFNIVCFFIFCELIFCYNGPCNYQTHYAYNVSALLGQEYRPDGTPIVSEVDLFCVHGKTYKFVVNDFIIVPHKKTKFDVGKDFLLQKELKGTFEGYDTSYRIFAASPVMFLSIFTSIILLFGICLNLNENEYSLVGLTIISGMTLLCVILM